MYTRASVFSVNCNLSFLSQFNCFFNLLFFPLTSTRISEIRFMVPFQDPRIKGDGFVVVRVDGVRAANVVVVGV